MLAGLFLQEVLLFLYVWVFSDNNYGVQAGGIVMSDDNSLGTLCHCFILVKQLI